MNPINRAKAEALIDHESPYCLSIYMPCVRAGRDVRQNPILFKNLVKEAESRLRSQDISEAGLEAMMRPLQAFAADDELWAHVDHGLAWLSTPRMQRQIDLPFAVDPLVVVGSRFHMTPIIAALDEERGFYVLSLSADDVRLYEGSRHELTEIPLDDTPHSLNDAKGHQLISEDLRRPTRGKPAGHIGAGESIVQGQSAGEINRWRNMRKFFSMVDHGVTEAIGVDGGPVILAGVERLQVLYREVTALTEVLPAGIEGAAGTLDEHTLRVEATARILAHQRELHAQRLQGALEVLGTASASDGLEESLIAASEGRVSEIFVDGGARLWGRFDPSGRAVKRGDDGEGEELIGRLVDEVWRHGGQVHVVSSDALPESSPILARMRYSL